MTIFRIIHHLQHIILVNIVSEEIPTHKGQHWKTKLTGKEKNRLQKCCCILCSCKMDWGEVESCLCSYVSNFKFMLEFTRAALTRLKRRGTVRLVVLLSGKALFICVRQCQSPFCAEYTARLCCKRVRVKNWPVCSSDLSPIENIGLIGKKKKTTRSSKKHLIYKTAAAGLLDPQTFKECVVRNRGKPDPNLFKMCS